MKKRTKKIIANTIVGLSLATSAYAMPLATVPAGNWIYPEFVQLQKDGILSTDSYRANKIMNRYEAAILVASAIDQYEKASDVDKARIDKLSAEFASELNKMGVRVAVPVPDAKKNEWKIGGDMRFRFHTDDPQTPGTARLKGSDQFDWRGRIRITGPINDQFTANARIVTNWSNRFGNTDSSYGSTAYFDVFNVKGNNVIGLDSVKLGRDNFATGNGLIGKPLAVDGIWMEKKSGDVTFSAFTGNPNSDSSAGSGSGTDVGKSNQFTVGQAAWQINSNAKIGLGYFWSNIAGTSNPTASGQTLLATNGASYANSHGYDLFGSYKLDDVTILGEYMGTTLKQPVNMDGNPKGWAVQLSNGTGPSAKMFFNNSPMTNVSKAGDSAWLVNYRHVQSGTTPLGLGGFDTMAVSYTSQPYNVYLHGTDNVKGWLLAYEFVPVKNLTVNFTYQRLQVTDRALTPKLGSDKLDTTYGLTVGFWF